VRELTQGVVRSFPALREAAAADAVAAQAATENLRWIGPKLADSVRLALRATSGVGIAEADDFADQLRRRLERLAAMSDALETELLKLVTSADQMHRNTHGKHVDERAAGLTTSFKI